MAPYQLQEGVQVVLVEVIAVRLEEFCCIERVDFYGYTIGLYFKLVMNHSLFSKRCFWGVVELFDLSTKIGLKYFLN